MHRLLPALPVLLTILAPVSATACSCRPEMSDDPAAWVEPPDVLILGRVLEAGKPDAPRSPVPTRVEVVESFKGGLSGVVVIGTESPRASSCGISLTPEERPRLISAKRRPDGTLWTGYCHDVFLRGRDPDEALRKLRAWKEAGSTPYDVCADQTPLVRHYRWAAAGCPAR